MKVAKSAQRVLSGRRAEVLDLLRKGVATVKELAESLELTDNAVRSQLFSLERDRLIRKKGLKQGTRRPHVAYEVTAKADKLSSNAYDALLNRLLGIMKDRLSPKVVGELLRLTGRSLAQDSVRAKSRPRARQQRITKALRLLETLGGTAQMESRDGRILLRSSNCPLAAVVAQHPEACRIIESLLTQMIGVPVRQQCLYGERPRCCFEIGKERASASAATR